MFNNIYHNRRVLITGHTGFKGSWLALWLSRLGADVTGYSLQPPTEPNHFHLLRTQINSIIGDVRDADRLKQVFHEEQPEIVFHLAAQAIVRRSYQDPVETFTSNVMGTVNLLDAARASDSVRAIVNITSDKCYENREQQRAYRETDALGGYDPYSASKGCAELVTGCWRNSFFNLADYGNTHQTLLATARAGNVIGGGDWAQDRLLPDIVRAFHAGRKSEIRNPGSTRPWQHVLEPLSGYLLLGQRQLEGRREMAQAWNFGPSDEENTTVGEIVDQVRRVWPEIGCEMTPNTNQPHEAVTLRLDCSKAHTKLDWRPVWNVKEAITKTAQWYRAYYETGDVLTNAQLDGYTADAAKRRIVWAEK